MSGASEPVFCDSIGDRTRGIDMRCCYPNDQGAPACRENLNPTAGTFSAGFDHLDNSTGFHVVSGCQNPKNIYFSRTQLDALEGNGGLPRLRFSTCANTPNLARYLQQGVLEPSITATVDNFIPGNALDDSLKNITAAVTDCLTATCSNARNHTRCAVPCSAVNLLINSTTPNLKELDRCLEALCEGGYDSLPYADADVVGIGVLSSYIMQGGLIVVLFFWLALFMFIKWSKSKDDTKLARLTNAEDRVLYSSINEKDADKDVKHQGRLLNLLDQFHQAQCYFSATIQVASLRYGIFDVDMLNTFLLIPLATNGVLPVLFTYSLLLHFRRGSSGATVLTIICWSLSSLVYWILYSHAIPINNEIQDEKKIFRVYQQFMFKLSALDACGGYSGLAACPVQLQVGKSTVVHASHKIRVLTPIIWTFSTACLLLALGEKIANFIHRLKQRGDPVDATTEDDDHSEKPEKTCPSIFENLLFYIVIALCFLVGIGMQLSLFSVALSLKMTDRDHWTFGQIIAITIWFPPFIAYFYEEMRIYVKNGFPRKPLLQQKSGV